MSDDVTRDDAVVYGRCPACGYVTLPVLELSPCGHADAPDVQPLDGPGVVYSWTAVGEEGETLMVMADFLDGALRVTGPLDATTEIAIGDEVVVAPGTSSPYVLRPH